MLPVVFDNGADLVVASTRSSFGLAEVKRNLIAGAGFKKTEPAATAPTATAAPKARTRRLEDIVVPVWSLLAWIVVLGTLLPFGVELLALRDLSATTVTMIAMLEPVGVSALGWVWFYEELSTVALIGGVAVVAGILLAQSARRAHVMVEPPHLG